MVSNRQEPPEASTGFLEVRARKAACPCPQFQAPCPRATQTRRAALPYSASPRDRQQRMVRAGKQQCSKDDVGADHLPSMTLRPSHTAPTRPVTIMVITALNV